MIRQSTPIQSREKKTRPYLRKEEGEGHQVLTQGVLLGLDDLAHDGALLRLLRAGLNVPQDQRHLHDVLNGRHQQVRELELLAARVAVAPLQGNNEGPLCGALSGPASLSRPKREGFRPLGPGGSRAPKGAMQKLFFLSFLPQNFQISFDKFCQLNHPPSPPPPRHTTKKNNI